MEVAKTLNWSLNLCTVNLYYYRGIHIIEGVEFSQDSYYTHFNQNLKYIISNKNNFNFNTCGPYESFQNKNNNDFYFL